jgi:hypothetical protein
MSQVRWLAVVLVGWSGGWLLVLELSRIHRPATLALLAIVLVPVVGLAFQGTPVGRKAWRYVDLAADTITGPGYGSALVAIAALLAVTFGMGRYWHLSDLMGYVPLICAMAATMVYALGVRASTSPPEPEESPWRHSSPP